MDRLEKKCSSIKHSNIGAVIFCQECNKFFCNKCYNFHSEIFENHSVVSLDKIQDDVFIDLCPKEHHHIKLEFFCKEHNLLCCSSCICKIKNEIYGQHRDCEVCLITDIKEEKGKRLSENLIILENLSKNFDNSIKEIKILLEKINENKEKLKKNIQNIFTKIRNPINDKEDKLLLEVDEKFSEIFIKDDIIKEIEKLPNKIKLTLEKGKNLEKNFKNTNLNKFISGCINIENNIQDILKINNFIKNFDSNKKIEIKFNIDEKKFNNFFDDIKNLGEITTKKKTENFNIQLKNPIYNLKYHLNNVLCLTLLNDGRLASGSRDNSIIIYNKTTYKPDLIIKKHNKAVCCICQLSSGPLASCSEDSTIKLYEINGDNYNIIQNLTFHTKVVYKIIELNNKQLVSCSGDSSIIFYSKDNSSFINDFKMNVDSSCSSVIQTKNKEICYSEYKNKIIFYDFIERKIKGKIINIDKRSTTDEWFIMINKDLLAIPGENKISIINVNLYSIIRTINVENSSWIFGICLFNENILLTGDRKYTIREWRIEGDNLICISKKEKAHDGDINYLLNLKNGHIASGSDGGTVKIW